MLNPFDARFVADEVLQPDLRGLVAVLGVHLLHIYLAAETLQLYAPTRTLGTRRAFWSRPDLLRS